MPAQRLFEIFHQLAIGKSSVCQLPTAQSQCHPASVAVLVGAPFESSTTALCCSNVPRLAKQWEPFCPDRLPQPRQCKSNSTRALCPNLDRAVHPATLTKLAAPEDDGLKRHQCGDSTANAETVAGAIGQIERDW